MELVQVSRQGGGKIIEARPILSYGLGLFGKPL
jgi:hypothetical protein